MTSHWSDRIVEILNSHTVDLRQLAEIAGYKAENFYIGSDLSKADLRGQDLREINFHAANLSGSIVDNHTKFDEIWDPRINWKAISRKRRTLLPHDLIKLVIIFQKTAHYSSPGWAIRGLLAYTSRALSNQPLMDRWASHILDNKVFDPLFYAATKKREQYIITMRDDLYNILIQYAVGLKTESAAVILGILIGLAVWAEQNPKRAIAFKTSQPDWLDHL
jgi:uncharacterized protein YjbI with pentapeptide repeats